MEQFQRRANGKKRNLLIKRLKRLRTEKRMTIREVARCLDVAESTYREWEYGRAIQGEPYVKLANVFEVSLSELMSGKGDGNEYLLDEIRVVEERVANIKKRVLLSGLN